MGGVESQLPSITSFEEFKYTPSLMKLAVDEVAMIFSLAFYSFNQSNEVDNLRWALKTFGLAKHFY